MKTTTRPTARPRRRRIATRFLKVSRAVLVCTGSLPVGCSMSAVETARSCRSVSRRDGPVMGWSCRRKQPRARLVVS